MKKGLELIEIYKTEDPAGFIPESELKKLSAENPAGGTATITTSSWACGATVALSIAVCSTFKCTSKCG
ncbi:MULTISPECIES: class II lanthipeptide, LchA2/BrtA2 family [Bacillaceae]|uniref:Class II lanthipeptide, LchA2/BrtA2 family n=1 Tax=Metabacillus sediminis TaxID=3117746 RepID=A0ABZ2NFM4_9BACI|nr:class II lanthipeptide, LchA2/BrtA2 family [Bacillus sp. SJS]KZZ84920.1 hypothetical protein AS29_007650 [Bacillus sp. SJS]